ncbi:hypothetical protein GCM10010124_04970 [Pilimelia terevasa]|uniref:Uncharacterized protein n=1 Tax=Pilimelia terevasa TaxID=53372 RepID=A0A8J3FE40_9ACTN|nr:hypothetical protein [Pilimelia terevasa]GGK15318.1 hypothetical protein GCM10010124_04970 [Pilimelia terevasa]
MSPETAPPTDPREAAAGMRAWFAYALVGANAALLLAALVGLLPSGRGPYSLYAAGRFSSFINVATIGFPVAAVYLATHRRPRLPGARLVTLAALVELGVAAACGTLFGAMIGLYGLVSYGPGAAAGLQAMLTWLAYLGLLAVAAVYGLRVWRALFARRRGPAGSPAVPTDRAGGPPADRTTFLRAGGAPPEQTSFLRTGAAPGATAAPGGASGSLGAAGRRGMSGLSEPAGTSIGGHGNTAPSGATAPMGGLPGPVVPAPSAADAPTRVDAPAAGAAPGRAPGAAGPSGDAPTAAGQPAPPPPAPEPPTVFVPASATPYQGGPPTVVPAAPVARPPRAVPRSGAVYGAPSRRPSPDVAAALAGQDPDRAAPPPPDATQVLSGPEGTQILPKATRPGPETTHLLPPHER